MTNIHQQPDRNFLGLPLENSSRESSGVLILPVPYEATTSYGSGTKNGPQAIIDASCQVEFYDTEFGSEPAFEYGIHTLPALVLDTSSPESAINGIATAVCEVWTPGKLLAIFGGEHGLSIGVARGLRQASQSNFVTVQLDAHTDLRDSYEGTPYSHASAMRRVSELSPVFSLGIRSLDVTEAQFLDSNQNLVTAHFADKMREGKSYLDNLASFVRGNDVFLTVDVDVFDPSIMPATGTPEPGGLGWYDVLEIIRTVAEHGNVICFDIVELAPVPGHHASDFTVAKLAYKICSLVMKSRA